MKYILIYNYTDIIEKAECEFYLTRYEISRQEVLVFDDKQILSLKVLELIGSHYKNFTYAIYEGKQIA